MSRKHFGSRLFRKYVALFIAVVSVALLINGGFEIWFSYREHRAALIRIQREQAEAASARIAEFFTEIQGQLGWTTQLPWTASTLEQRRFDAVRLLRQVPAITELSEIDQTGHEQLHVSRLAMDVIGSNIDLSNDPKFLDAMAHKVYYGPVYFRRDSEPYMTLALAGTRKSDGVSVAEVNLKLIWDVISQIKVGLHGGAYVVDERGHLIADPDLSLVLRNTDMSGLAQVQAARNAERGMKQEQVQVATDMRGRGVLTASAVIEPLGWLVFVELPVSEAYAPLYASIARSGWLLLGALALAALAGMLLARRMVGPIQALRAGAARIGSGDLGQRIEVRTGDEVEALADQFNDMAGQLQRSYADLEHKVEERTAELSEALEQQTATAEVLQVINSSPGDLAPVFDAMLEKAVRLLNADFGILWRFEDGLMRLGASYNVADAFIEHHREPMRPGPESGPGRMMRGGSGFITGNFLEFPPYLAGDPAVRSIVELAGARSAVIAPLRKEGAALGSITIYRKEVQPFSEKQLAVLENFAVQAVIAIENARLITETREALEQQTATAEVLQVINSSPGDLTPVFDAMLEKAMRLCEATHAHMFRFDGEKLHPVAARGDPGFAEWLYRRGPQNAPPGSSVDLFRQGEPFVHQLDMTKVAAYRENAWLRELIDRSHGRTAINVPLRNDRALLGSLHLYRTDVRPFSDTQIALLQNFAAQAVIAIENARLITETREALDQQTATAEVLQVINASPGDLAPVFDAMLEKALSLCEAQIGGLSLYDDNRYRVVATRGTPLALVEFLGTPQPILSGSTSDRLRLGENIIQVADLAADHSPEMSTPGNLAMIELGGARSTIWVSLRKDDRPLGFFTIYRQEVRPFSDSQIALLQNFAAQAVIAMENARLMTETREALEQQTATAEVLQVINSSPGDLAPVFDAMLEKAMRLCDTAFGSLQTYDGEQFRSVAERGLPEAFADRLRRGYRPGATHFTNRLIGGERFVQVLDLAESDTAQGAFAIGGMRTLLSVPLLREEKVSGIINLARDRVEPFSDKQIALLQNFAAQAVIAIENARLMTETQEALDRQTATAEVLQVINSSPGDLAPVFDAMLEKALHLCGAAFGELYTYDGERFHTVALRGASPEYAELRVKNPPNPSAPGTVSARILATKASIHVLDLQAEDVYQSALPSRRVLVDLGGARTLLAVPLLKDDAVFGYITIYRREVRAFSEKQATLLGNFAAQAVIAMENARLLGELRARTDELAQRQAELRVTFENMADGVAMFDEELRLAAWNGHFQEILDLPEAFLAEPRSYSDYIHYLADRGEFGIADPGAELRRLTENIGRHSVSERTRPDGRILEVRHNPVPGGGFVLIYGDITEHKRSEAEIRAAKDAAEEASRAIEAAYRDLKAAQANLIQAEKMASLGQLTAGIAHEIKNPLNFVNNFAGLSVELLDELKETAAPALEQLDETARAEIDEVVEMLTSNLEKIGEHGRRADGIVRSMLAHSRGGSGERQSADLNALVEEALNLAYHGARAQDQSFNITLERDFAAGMPPVELVPQDMTRVLLNLFGNGFYAANKRRREAGDAAFKPVLTVSTRDLGDAVEIKVRDNGTGIPPEIRDKLFQPFFTTKPTGEGTGLGLSISYDIVTQQHGGTIAVDSRPGDFTEFTVRLPRAFGASRQSAA